MRMQVRHARQHVAAEAVGVARRAAGRNLAQRGIGPDVDARIRGEALRRATA